MIIIRRLDGHIAGIERTEVPRCRYRVAVFRRLEIKVDEFMDTLEVALEFAAQTLVQSK